MAVIKHRPFHSFTNPFAAGTSPEQSLEDLVDYSFLALSSWAADRGHPRKNSETPLEFASRLSALFASLKDHPHQLALLVVMRAYASGVLPAHSLETLENLWDNLCSAMPLVTAPTEGA